jgi:phosphatidylglycerophosphate synthase
MLQCVRLNTHCRRLSIEFLLTGVTVLVALAGLATLLQRGLSLSYWFPWKAGAAFVLGGLLTLVLALRHLVSHSFGAANQATLARAGLLALLVGLIGEISAPWVVVVAGSIALALDGLDGWLARRLDCASAFGARFDMETDAALLLIFTLLAWQYGKVGPWIVLAGVMRYLFVAAGALLPFLTGPLPPSRRRQTAFVIQAIALIGCISPIVVPPVSGAIALIGFALLAGSFAIDVAYLTRVAENDIGQEQSPT